MRVAIECAGFTPGEADQLRRAMATFKHTGGVSKFGEKPIAGMIANGSRRSSPRKPQAARRLRQLWLPREPCGELRADRLCVLLDEVLASRRVLRGASQCAADGSTRRRRSCAMRATTASKSYRSASTPPDGTAPWSRRTRRIASRYGSACAWSKVSPTPMLPPSSPPAPSNHSSRSTISGAVPALRPPRSSGSPKPMHSVRRCSSPAATRCGRSRRCAMNRCRCSPPPQPVNPDPSQKSGNQRSHSGR